VGFDIRRYRDTDLNATARVWRESQLAAVTLRPEATHTPGEYREYLRDHVIPQCEVWVAEQRGEVVAFMARKDDLLDHLYVATSCQGAGIGSALLALARERSPGGLRLFTLQQNTGARAFYERRGFRAIRFGVSPPPESEPDVEYVSGEADG
jgi:ribosomal protein S18 acetylase RimI-like enzyme